MRSFSKGKDIHVPGYDFAAHARVLNKTEVGFERMLYCAEVADEVPLIIVHPVRSSLLGAVRERIRKRAGHAAQNFSILNRIALNLLKQDRIQGFWWD